MFHNDYRNFLPNNYEVRVAEETEFIKLKKITYYLISLFYKNGCKYNCSRSKINRLLTIYKLCSITFDEDCFHFSFTVDNYINIRALGRLLNINVYTLPLEVKGLEDGITVFREYDNRQVIREKFDDYAYVPKLYHVTDEELKSVGGSKVLLELIFRRFASYPLTDLGGMIKEMYNNIPFVKKVDKFNYSYDSLDIDEFIKFLNSEDYNQLYKDNEIYNFIRGFNNILLSSDNKTLNGNFNDDVKKLIKQI